MEQGVQALRVGTMAQRICTLNECLGPLPAPLLEALAGLGQHLFALSLQRE
jgi:hypothetical protein